mmetsp:Transcript_5018/g.14211  ORF Transcript_5018/g.14211 Transcript_5018/m.14211 type:complete len:248 (-) Transcript_5018:14-757(-)
MAPRSRQGPMRLQPSRRALGHRWQTDGGRLPKRRYRSPAAPGRCAVWRCAVGARSGRCGCMATGRVVIRHRRLQRLLAAGARSSLGSGRLAGGGARCSRAPGEARRLHPRGDAPARHEGDAAPHLGVGLRLGVAPSGVADAADVVPELLAPGSGPTLRGGLEVLDDAVFQGEVVAAVRHLHALAPGDDGLSDAGDDKVCVGGGAVHNRSALLQIIERIRAMAGLPLTPFSHAGSLWHDYVGRPDMSA